MKSLDNSTHRLRNLEPMKKAIILASIFLVTVMLLPILGVWAVLSLRTSELIEPGQNELRPFPYPYHAALAVTSDIDSTDTVEEFLAIQEFLNTRNQTPLGIGVGLEIGNSFFPTASNGHFAFMSENPHDKQVIIDLNRLGYIDFIHSFGHTDEREEIRKVTMEMVKHGIRVDVWINHAKAKSDLGPFSYALGDNIDSAHYHADFSLNALGVNFVWMRDVTSIIGQDRPLAFADFFAPIDQEHYLSSVKNLTLKELYKFALSPVWPKYRQRSDNSLLNTVELDNGRPVFDITRASLSHRGIGAAATAAGLAESLRPEVIEELINNGGTMIMYTHLGKNDGPPYLPPDSVAALRYLDKVHHQQGRLLITTSSRLLNYVVNRDNLQYDYVTSSDGLEIRINAITDSVRGEFIPTIEELRGITFYIDQNQSTFLTLAGRRIPDVIRNRPDETGHASLSIPWTKLPRPDELIRNYKDQGIF